jgi:hypothetical protein
MGILAKTLGSKKFAAFHLPPAGGWIPAAVEIIWYQYGDIREQRHITRHLRQVM